MSIAMAAADPTDHEAPADGAPKPPPAGRVREQGLSTTDRNWGVALHLSPLSAFVLGPPGLLAPLVLWLIRRDGSSFNDDHGREIINFLLSLVIWHVALAITIIGIVLWPVLWVIAFVGIIRAATAASRGEYFRYPMTVRML